MDVRKPFWEHIEELRRRLLSCVVLVALCTLGSYPFVDRVIEYLARPVGHFIYLQVTEAFFIRLKIALVLGIFISVPFLLYHFWKFIVVALTISERKILAGLLPSSYFLFVSGANFAFWYLVPEGVKFLTSYSSPQLVATISIDSYISFVGTFCLVLGCVFQMPLVTYLLGKLGISLSEKLASQRRTAFLVLYILSAVLTPGPDPVTALMLFVPMYTLFEVSLITHRWACARKKN